MKKTIYHLRFLSGKVLKVDGPYCAVRFPQAATTPVVATGSQDKTTKEKEDEAAAGGILSESTRLLRKDELQVSHGYLLMIF